MHTLSLNIFIFIFGCFSIAWSARITIEPDTTNPKYPNAIRIVCEPDSSDMEGNTIHGLYIYREHLFNIQAVGRRLIETFGKLETKKNPKGVLPLHNPKASDVGIYECRVHASRAGFEYSTSVLGVLKADRIERCYSVYENCQKGYLKPHGATSPCLNGMVSGTRDCIRRIETCLNVTLTTDTTLVVTRHRINLKLKLNKDYKPSQECQKKSK